MSEHLSKTNQKFDLLKINFWTSLIIAAAATLIIVGALLSKIKFEIAIEVVLELIVGYFVLNTLVLLTERQELLEETNENFKNLVEHVGVMTIIKTPEEYYKKLQSSIENAHDSVRLLYLTQTSPISIGKYSQDYWEWFQKYAKDKSDKVVIKRIASLDSEEKKKWVIDKTIELAETSNYGIRVYNPCKFLPLIGVEVIDNKEVFMFGPHGKTPRWLYVNNPDVAEGTAQYFEELWSKLSDYEIKALGAVATKDSIEQCINKCLDETKPCLK